AAAIAKADEMRRLAAAGPGGFAEHFDEVPVVLVLLADLRALAAIDRDLPRYTLAGGASIYPFAWNLLLAARAEGLGGVITTGAAGAAGAAGLDARHLEVLVHLHGDVAAVALDHVRLVGGPFGVGLDPFDGRVGNGGVGGRRGLGGVVTREQGLGDAVVRVAA